MQNMFSGDEKILDKDYEEESLTIDELKKFYKKAVDSDFKETINLLFNIFNEELIPVVQIEINYIKKEGLKELNLVKKIVIKYNLLRESKEEEKKKEGIIKIIYCEIINE